MKKMFVYSTYGLRIKSFMPLPELLPATELEWDISIDVGSTDCIPVEVLGKQWYLKITPTQAVLYLPGLVTFVVCEGLRILIDAAPDADEDLVRAYLVGMVMGIVLFQRGLSVLHASAVEVNGCSVAFMGNSGQGKSSLAAALQRQGYALRNDDVTPVSLNGDLAIAYPGFPQMKLSSESAAVLEYSPDLLFELNSLEHKRGYRVIDTFTQTPLPLRCIYLLERGDDMQVTEPLNPSEALMELISQSWPTRLGQPGGSHHFLQCCDLAKRVPFYRLHRTDNLSRLPDLAKFVKDHLEWQAELNPNLLNVCQCSKPTPDYEFCSI
ncbi:MAG TPA: hypothetical protein V6D14_04470 [Coleofasciculaceae cyanobacterium]|jgi:hypothetical protein